jgi:release factor glutamine methyltransferase
MHRCILHMAMNQPSYAHALAAAQTLGLDRLDAQLLLLHALGKPGDARAWLLAHDTDLLSEEVAETFRAMSLRRAAGEPLAYIVGSKEFFGLMLQVDARVLVPRPDTETLVDWAIELFATKLAAVATPRVLDLGTGSGAIALAVKHAVPRAKVSALDASDDALMVAESNARRLGFEVEFVASHWWQALGPRQFELALSNPPYIADTDPHLPALAHEPRTALVSGPDGFDAIRAIVANAPAHLAPGSWLLLEHGHDQADAVHALLAAAGFSEVESRRDLAGIRRCSGGLISATQRSK